MPQKEPQVQPNRQADYAGHRERVRMRFLRNGFDGMASYEVLEMLLMPFIPRKDVKPIAKTLLRKYQTISNIISLPVKVLQEEPGLGLASAIGLKTYFECSSYCLHEQCTNPTLLCTPENVKHLVRLKLGFKYNESYMLLFMNSRNHITSYKTVAEGVVDQVSAYPRQIVEMALAEHASKVILVHNHPSGVVMPSPEDIKATHDCSAALETVGIVLEDHLIVSRNDFFSFVDSGIPLQRKQQGNISDANL